jgi:hypothetical protein
MQGYPRVINSILGRLEILSEQAKGLGVSASSRLSPYLEAAIPNSKKLGRISVDGSR